MTTKGQITIPRETRERLRLVAGSRVDFVENEDGDIVLRPKVGDIRGLRGLIRYAGPPVTLEEIDHAIQRSVALRGRR